MARKQRIEYEHAFYHVMNRGRGRRAIFHDDTYYQTFLEILQGACDRFTGIVHAYCLMGNHYHLLIETPNANLGRIMRHVNGVYTQRHNRLKQTDGPLFRGRYKAILVDADNYLLQLTRYIHRNPIETKPPLVDKLEAYRWSSYATYINKSKPEPFLEREMTYQLLGHKQRYRGYAEYVNHETDEELMTFYNKGNIATVIGDRAFKSWLHEQVLPQIDAEQKARITHSEVSMAHVTSATAKYYKTTSKTLRKLIKGPQPTNDGRKIAMYLSQEVAGETLQSIADFFGLSHSGSVSFITHAIRKRLLVDKHLRAKVDGIIRVL